MFDFDDLETSLPPQLTRATEALSDDELAGLRAALRADLARGKLESLPVLITRALICEKSLQARIPVVAEALFALLEEACEKQALNAEACAALTYTLYQLAFGLSVYEVVSRRGPSADSPCVLLLGFAGSAVDQLEPQAEFYRSRGFSVVATAPTLWPETLRAKQDAAVAQELGAALAGRGRLVLHLCSNGGVMKGIALVQAWATRTAPLDALPPLAERLAAIVFECAPGRALDPTTGEVLGSPRQPPTRGTAPAAKQANNASATGGGDDPFTAAVIEGEVDMCRRVIMGCVGGLCKRHLPGMSYNELLQGPAADTAQAGLREAARYAVVGPPSWAAAAAPEGSQEPAWGFPDFEGWERAAPRPLARLFLHAREDFIIPRERVEAYARYTQRYNPRAVVQTACVAKAAHCRLWDCDRAACAEALDRLLAAAGVAPPDGAAGA